MDCPGWRGERGWLLGGFARVLVCNGYVEHISNFLGWADRAASFFFVKVTNSLSE